MGILDNFKDLFKIADAANNVELYKNLSELQTRVMELEENNRQLRDEKSQLQQTLDLREKMHFKEPPFKLLVWLMLARKRRLVEAAGVELEPSLHEQAFFLNHAPGCDGSTQGQTRICARVGVRDQEVEIRNRRIHT